MISMMQYSSEKLPRRMAVLYCLIVLVVCDFTLVALTIVTQWNPDLGQTPSPDKLGVKNLAIFPVNRSVKIRKKVNYISPPDEVSLPLGGEDAKSIRSVLVPRTFVFTVVQQPENNPYYVSSSRNQITEFSLVRQYNNIGLLAHNNLAGNSFKYLHVGQEIYIIHTDGHADRYTVSDIYRFRALEPTNINSQFIDLDSKEIFTANEVFERMYTGAEHVTFQTCIYASGDNSWGRLFVIAKPATETQ